MGVVLFSLDVRDLCASIANPTDVSPAFGAIQEVAAWSGALSIPGPFSGLRIAADQTPFPGKVEVIQPSEVLGPLEPHGQPEIDLVLQMTRSRHALHLSLHELRVRDPASQALVVQVQHPSLLSSAIEERANAAAHPLRVDGQEDQQENQEEGPVDLEDYVTRQFRWPWKAGAVRNHGFDSFLHVETAHRASDQGCDHPCAADF